VARRASGLVVVPPALTCNAASTPSGGNPPGEAAKRRLPLLQLLAVSPPRRVAAPRQSTLGDLSHSQIEWEQAPDFPASSTRSEKIFKTLLTNRSVEIIIPQKTAAGKCFFPCVSTGKDKQSSARCNHKLLAPAVKAPAKETLCPVTRSKA
ncbi:hypothetical protein, partial [Herbaspirillum huttiense]